jgi:hypothetical protein
MTYTDNCDVEEVVVPCTHFESNSTKSKSTYSTKSTTSILCELCSTDEATMYCTNKVHGFCHECINAYAQAAFKDMGSYCRLVQSSTSTNTSNVGELPCPFFERDGCMCSNIPLADFNWTAEAFNAFKGAERRLGALEAAATDRQHQAVREEQETRNDLNDVMVQAVQSILAIGASVSCPNCHYRGEKDDACMHISCLNCQCSWCYCCGRPRRNVGWNLCSTCDQRSSHIQSHAGWNNCQVEPSEGSGYGALHEFHRKRMAFFLRQLVEGVPNLPWSDFWIRNEQTLLSQVPTPNRNISLEDIANAVPPCFPPTTINQLQWLNDSQPIIDILREQSERVATNTNNVVLQPIQLDIQIPDDEIQAQIEHILEQPTDDPDLQAALVESLLHSQIPQPQSEPQTERQQRRRRGFRLFNRRR